MPQHLATEFRGSLGVATVGVAEPAWLVEQLDSHLHARAHLHRQHQHRLDATRERVQFGKALNAFQAVAHSLATMSGELERARAAAALATAAVSDYGFDSPQAAYAVTAAKVAVGRAVEPVSTIAHQLHGAIGVTLEHGLWLATMRARSWADEFGTPAGHALTLGRMALATDPWELVVGRV